MNKLLSAVSGIGMLFAVGAAQAADMLSDKQLDTVTAGTITLNLPASSNFAAATAQGISPYNAAAAAGHCNGNCVITVN